MVLIWLGHEDDDTRLAFEIMDWTLPLAINLSQAKGKANFSYSFNSVSLYERLGVPINTSADGAPLFCAVIGKFHRC